MLVTAVALGAALFVLVLAGSAAAALWWFLRRVEGEYFEARGIRLHYTDEGSGEPVILLHGFAVNADLNWRLPGLTGGLSEEHRVVALDLRGHGLSDKPLDPGSYGSEMAQDVIDLLDHLGISKAHVVGYSLGGIITLKLAATHPKRVISAAPLGAGWERADDSAFFAAMDGIAEALESGAGVPPLSASLDGDRKPPGFLHTLWVRVMTRYLNDGNALAALVRGLRGLTVDEDEVRRIAVPVCSIVGTEDTMKLGVDAMVGVVPNHTVVFVEGADHLQATRSPELRAALQAFLRANAAATQNGSR